MTYWRRRSKIIRMKKFIRFLIVFCLTVATTGVVGAYTNRGTAKLRVMNKAAGKVTELNIPTGSATDFEKIKITVNACKQTDPFDAENFYAFVVINRADGTRIFSNWMDRNNPGKMPVQDADYDVWLVKCE